MKLYVGLCVLAATAALLSTAPIHAGAPVLPEGPSLVTVGADYGVADFEADHPGCWPVTMGSTLHEGHEYVVWCEVH